MSAPTAERSLTSAPTPTDKAPAVLERDAPRLLGARGAAVLLIALLAVVMFIPVRRYALPVGLSFALEPYRVVIALGLLLALVGLLVTPGVRWQPLRFGWAVGLFAGTLVLSVAVNAVALQQSDLLGVACGALVNFAFLTSVLFLVRQLIRTPADVQRVLLFLVWSGVVVAASAVVERATHYNVFQHLGDVLPLTVLRDASEATRAGGARAYGSAQHPIALSVLFTMLIPIALYLAEAAPRPRNLINRRIVYGLATAVLLAGTLVAVSRTAMVALAAMFVFVLILRPTLAALLAAFAVPALLVGGVLLPKLVGELVLSFLDIDSLVASQLTSPGWTGQGRLADLGPALAEVAQHPVFGVGFGSRIVAGENVNAFILDNQPLGILMEAGVVGTIGLAVFVLTPIVLLLRAIYARRLDGGRAKLAFALTASLIGYAVSLFFYDAFGFLQSYLVWLVLLAIAGWVLTTARPGRTA